MTSQFRFHLPTVALWTCLGVLIILTSILVLAVGIEALYIVVMGWMVLPFFAWWLGKKLSRLFGRE